MVIHWRRAPSPKKARPRASTATSRTKRADGSGAVYIFTRSGSTWAQQAYVKPWNTTVRGGLFGYSVGLSGNGDTMAVGTYDEDRGKGAVYIFTRTGSTWAQQNRLTASNAEPGDSLGCSIAISDDGNTVVAGAFDEDSILRGIQPPNEGSNDAASDVSTGAAYVFVRNGSLGRNRHSSRPPTRA